jgi:hypothetical protein
MSRRKRQFAESAEVKPALGLVSDEPNEPAPKIRRGYFLVGDAPPQWQVGQPHLWLLPDRSLTMHTGNLLMRLAGYSFEQYAQVFPLRTNLFPLPARRWATSGKAQAEAIKRQAAANEALGIVVIGQETAVHFGLKGWPMLTWSGDSIRPVAVIPHPSGRSGFWSEPEANARSARFFQGLMESVKEAEEVLD